MRVHMSYFNFIAVTNRAAIDDFVNMLFYVWVRIHTGQHPRNKIAGLKDYCICNFDGSCDTDPPQQLCQFTLPAAAYGGLLPPGRCHS